MPRITLADLLDSPRGAMDSEFRHPFTGSTRPNMAPPSPLSMADALEMAAMSQVPGLSDVASGGLALSDLINGNYGSSALNGLGALPIVPALGGIMKAEKPMQSALQEQKMREMNLKLGLYRGGATPEVRRTGGWFSPRIERAEEFANSWEKNNPGKVGDVREYATPATGIFDLSKQYNPRLAKDVADMLEDPYFGKRGAALAADLRKYYVETGNNLPGHELWQSLAARFGGNEGAAEVLNRLKKFNGATGMRGDDVMIFPHAPVRLPDAEFDPAKRHLDDLRAGLDGSSVIS